MFFKQVKIVCAILFLCTSSVLCDYCHANNNNDPSKNILCACSPENHSTSCTDVHKTGLSKKDIAEILQAHEVSRRKLNGPLSSLLVWDIELSVMAQMWANQCPTHKDECRSLRGTMHNPVYQSVLRKALKHGIEGIDWSAIVAVLFDSKAQRELGGHHSVVNRIGCGSVIAGKFNNMESKRYAVTSKAQPTLFLVCNYSIS